MHPTVLLIVPVAACTSRLNTCSQFIHVMCNVAITQNLHNVTRTNCYCNAITSWRSYQASQMSSKNPVSKIVKPTSTAVSPHRAVLKTIATNVSPMNLCSSKKQSLKVERKKNIQICSMLAFCAWKSLPQSLSMPSQECGKKHNNKHLDVHDAIDTYMSMTAGLLSMKHMILA